MIYNQSQTPFPLPLPKWSLLRFCTCYEISPTLYGLFNRFKSSVVRNKWEIFNNDLLKNDDVYFDAYTIILRQNHLHSWNIIKFSGGVHGAFAASVLLTCCVFIGSTLIKLISCIAAQLVNEINLDMTSTYFRRNSMIKSTHFKTWTKSQVTFMQRDS